MNSTLRIALAASALGLGACATTLPPPLSAAREAYGRASTGAAAHLAPADVYEARKALDQANREFVAHGDSPAVQDYAYIAYRKVELAQVRARIELDRQKIAEAERQGVVVRDQQVGAALARPATERELEAERQARAAADARLNGAMRDVGQIAEVHEETRGVVISFHGAELFPFGNAVLLETGKARLNQVAEALRTQGSDKRITVEGHTDGAGSNAINQPLSENCANAVREYLLSRGIEAGRVTALGRGSSRPVVDSRAAENRTNNRRVEIIIEGGSISAR